MAQNTMMVAANVAEQAVVVAKEEINMANVTVKALQEQAKTAGIKGYSKMKKADLLVAIKARGQAKKDSEVKTAYPAFPGDSVTDKEMDECLIPVSLAPIPAVVEQTMPAPVQVEVLECSVPVGSPQVAVQAPAQKTQKPIFKARNAAERFNAVLAWLYDQGYHSKRRGYGYTISSKYLEYIVYSTYGWKSGKWALENGKLTQEQIENSAKLIEFLRAKGIIKPAVVTSSKGVKFYGAEYNGMGKDKMTPVKAEHQEAFLSVETARVNTWRIHVEQFREMCKEMIKVIK